MRRNKVLLHNSWVFVALHVDTAMLRPQWPGKRQCLAVLIPLWRRVRLEIAFPRTASL